jgi:hypothetical protein
VFADGAARLHIMDGVSEDQKTAPPAARARLKDQEPQPEPIRFFGTTWVLHDGGYGWRRAGAGAGSLAAAALGALVLRIGFSGLSDAHIGGFVTAVAVVGFAVCSALAFQRTWRGFSARRTPGQSSDQGLHAIGFIGSLLAYGVRCLAEAPGEGLRRAEYEAARARHSARKGRPEPKPRPKRGR